MKGHTNGMANLNQVLLRGLPFCKRVFWVRENFSDSLPILEFIKNVSLINPSLDPSCGRGGFTPGMTLHSRFEASTRLGSDDSLLAQHLHCQLASADFLRTDV